MPLVNIQSTEDLKSVLLRQKMITRRAAEDLGRIVTNEAVSLIENEPEEDQHEKTLLLIRTEALLLENYAKHLTFTEINALPPKKAEAMKWGATFGVSLLVGELILEQVKQIQGSFSNILRILYTLLLKELDNPQTPFMIDPLMKAVSMEITAPNREISPEERLAIKTKLIIQLVDTFATVSASYGIMEIYEGDKYALTPVGKRVLLHLIDIETYIQLLSEAHKRFQREKPILPTT